MFTIRKEQMIVFEAKAFDSFADRVYQYVCRSFPDRCTALGELAAREEVSHDIRRAFDNGLTAEDDVVRYTLVAFALHRDFDRDPALSWAAEILSQRDTPDWLRCERLYQYAMRQLRKMQTQGGEEDGAG